MWEFKLRPGVTFSNGQPFTADDVAFTIDRAPTVPNTTGGFGFVVRAIAKVEIIDPLTLHLHTKGSYPNLPNDMSNLAVVSRQVGAGATTEDYNSGKAAIGTGPFRMTGFTPGASAELVRNDAWWGPRPDWEKVSMRFIRNAGARTAALIAGDVDLIDTPSPNDLPRLRDDPRFTVWSVQGTRLVYLTVDQMREGPSPFVTDAAGTPLPRNPLRDLRVRQALSSALNRTALSERVLQGTGQPNGQWMPPGSYSYNPEVPVPAFDPDRARRLLAEAGLPQGFRTVIHVPTDTRPTDPIVAQAVAQMWARIGVATTVETMPTSAYQARAKNRDFSFGISGWGSTSGEAGYALVNVFNSDSRERGTGMYNRSGYANPDLDALTDKALATLDADEREKLLQQAVAISMNDVAVIPLYQMLNFWVSRKGIEIDPAMHERTQAINARLTR